MDQPGDHAADLALARARERGEREALATLDRLLAARVRPLVARTLRDDAGVDDVMQAAVGEDDVRVLAREPGRTSVLAWLKDGGSLNRPRRSRRRPA